MSRRTDKKRLKRINQVQTSTPAAETPTEATVTEAVAETSAASTVTVAVESPAETPVTESAANAPAASTVAIVVETPDETPVAEEAAPAAPAYGMYIQYKNAEYDTEEIAKRILEKCASEGMDTADLKIYVKPEDKKAYYACAGGNSYVTL